MDADEFEKLIADIGLSSVPEPFRSRIENVVFLIEDDVTDEVRKEAGIGNNETLLGFYHGVPHTERGDGYGVGFTMPDRIYIFRLPTLEEAELSGKTVWRVVEETIWHEVGHHFGLDEEAVMRREREMGW